MQQPRRPLMAMIDDRVSGSEAFATGVDATALSAALMQELMKEKDVAVIGYFYHKEKQRLREKFTKGSLGGSHVEKSAEPTAQMGPSSACELQLLFHK